MQHMKMFIKMHNNKPINLIEIVIDEIALEGLDGITLEALWQRLATKLGDTLPLKNSFMEQIWKICLELPDFKFYELENPREKLVIFDRYELEYLNGDVDKEYERDIYPHCPIEDVKLGIRGSCSTYYTRKDISCAVKNLSVSEAEEKYGQKLVIVASQILREQALIESYANPTLQLPISHYCLLERIGRARTIGEVTIKKSSNIKEDAKSLFYIRKGLQQYGLIRKQIYCHGSTGLNSTGLNTGTLIHLTRFYNTRKPKVIMWAEHLINYLKSKENYAAEYNEVKNELNLDYSIKKFFKIQILQKVFRTDIKVPYRSYYPNSIEKEWQIKNNPTRERVIRLVTLNDPNIEVADLWRTEEVNEDDDHYQLDIRKQKLNVPFLKQVYEAVEAKESKGASQTELATELGYTKLISRTLVRNLVKAKVVCTYLDDIGRQRTTKYVSKKFESKSSYKKQLDLEMSKMKEYRRSMQIPGKLVKETNQKIVAQFDVPENNVEVNVKNEPTIVDTTVIDTNNVPTKDKEDCKQTSNENIKQINYIKSKIMHKKLLFAKINQILRKYKLFKSGKRYQYRLPKKINKMSGVKNTKTKLNKESEKIQIKNNIFEVKNILDDNNMKVLNSDVYKTIEAKLIVQKPECKKKSQKIAVVGFLHNEQNPNSKKPSTSNISYRLLRRANWIIKCVKEHKILTDTHKLMKFIHEKEDQEGLDIKIDKNSLIRLLQKLAEDNFIKYIKLILKFKKPLKQKIIYFVCDPYLDENDALVQTAVEQEKLKFCLSASHVPKASDNTKQIVRLNTNNSMTLGKKHGYCPKFIRMKTMHLYLYHLIFDHPQESVEKTILLENIKNEGLILDESVLDIYSKVYTKEISWKMFIPPLPKYQEYPSGWALMSDVLLRIPLSLFVKLHNVNFEVPGLHEYLDHPIKQHYLVKDLPTPIRNLLFYKRKYIFNFHEIVARLCYIGLVQFGPQMLKEKDQVFIHLNRHSELMDTTSSAAGYHRIEDKPYPVTKFTFTSLGVVENYWYEMWNTCINTDLGGRTVVEGKDILLEDLSRKTEMIQALKPKTIEEAEKCDTGLVPGDRKGAAGIDSAFFPHLKRNWNWVSTNTTSYAVKKETKPIKLPKPTGTLAKSVARGVSKLSNIQKKTLLAKKRSFPVKQNKLTIASTSSGIKTIDPAKSQQKGKRALPVNFPIISSKPPKIIRKVLPRKPMRKRVKYDEIDFSALQRMDKLRVDWEQHEDNILLVCKVAMVYLCPNPRRNLVTCTAIRDILRSYSFTSYNKTSRACQRRLLYMLKQPKTVNSVLLGVEEIKQDYFVNKRFGGMVDSVRGEDEDPVEYENRIEKTFKELVAYIAKKYYNISDMEQREPVTLPKTIQEFNIFYTLKLPTKTITAPGISKEVREVNDIHTTTINSVIHSSMCCGKERRSWAYQLFKVYQQYPEYLLRNAMLKIRADQMVTMKKNYMCAYKKFGNCMPMSSSQYQLSSAYYYKFQTKWPYEIFSESYNILVSLLENYVEKSHNPIDGIEVKPGLGGIVATIHDFIGSNNMDIDIDIPDQIIMLDPALPEKDEVYQRIALRYQSILEGLTSDYSEQLKNCVTDNSYPNISDSQTDSNNATVTTEQQSFVDIRSTKRPIEHDYCSPRKKQKMDNEESQEECKKEISDSELDEINKNIQSIIDSRSLEVDRSLIDVHNENEVPIIDISHANINSLLLDSNYSNEQIIPAMEDIKNSGKCLDSNNHENTNVETDASCLPAEDVHIESEPLHEKTGKNIGFGVQPSMLNPQADQTRSECQSNKMLRRDSGLNIDSEKITSIRVSNLLKRMNSPKSAENIEIHNDINDVRTRQTRIAMLKMREELHDLTFHDSHHAHEYFVVNSFKLFYSLLANEEEKKCLTVYRNMELPRSLIPMNVDAANQLLDSIKKSAIFPKNPMSYEELKKEIVDKAIFNWNDVNEICKFIKTKTEFGATLHELVCEFSYIEKRLADILAMLSEKRIVLRAGIVTVRYIYYRYVNPWIIHSYKILRLEKESHQTVPEGSVYVLDSDESSGIKEKETNKVMTATNLFYSSPVKLNTEVNLKNTNLPDNIIKTVADHTKEIKDGDMEVGEEITKDFATSSKDSEEIIVREHTEENAVNEADDNASQTRLRRNRTVLLKQKDIYRSAKLLDFNTAEEIKVVIKPWIRIDGVLNRRVLDRMLGAVLCYCIEKPGISLTSVQNRFTPAIQPYHTRELIEILVKLACVNTTVQRVSKVSLFSKPAKLDFTGNPDLVADSDSIVIEPTIQASLKFGMFLSNRSYNLDFLSSL